MNVAEANAWNTRPAVPRDRRQREHPTLRRPLRHLLAGRARAVLNAGPVTSQVARLVETVHSAVQIAADHPDWPEEVRLPGRPVETTQPAGGVL